MGSVSSMTSTDSHVSDTPRTDALAGLFPNGGMGLDKQQCITQLLEAHGLLERELAAANAKLDWMSRATDAHYRLCKGENNL